jgi:predicted Zn-dependent peptidase
VKSQFERSSMNRIRLHVLPTDRFKTFAISAYIGTPLREDTVTSVALAPFVLRRGTESLPETKMFRERLDDMYGAGFGFDVYKRGDYQMVQFRMDIIEDRFVKGAGSLLRDGLRFLGEAITRPALENGHFYEKYVAAEKDTIRKKLEAIVNDKIRYASERCIEEMCKNEPYRLHPLGKIEALDTLTPEGLYESYAKWLEQAPIDLYVVGNTTMEEVSGMIGEAFSVRGGTAASYSPGVKGEQPGEVQTVVERLDVSQGKLNMGLRSPVTYSEDAYSAALMYNGILGAFPHSKLFINVREKASLAYYASSRFDGHKGILTIQSGIEIENYEKAVDIIRKQLEAMENGEISDIELSQTKAMISNQLRETEDSAFEMIGFDFNTVLSGRERTVSQIIEEINQIGTAEIQQVARGVKLDTIYFLRDREGE